MTTLQHGVQVNTKLVMLDARFARDLKPCRNPISDPSASPRGPRIPWARCYNGAVMGLKIIGIVAAVTAVGLVLAACAPASAGSADAETTLTVFAAASLSESFQALAAAYEADHPDVNVAFNFAGSQTLRTQIEHGAQADIFASANWEHMATVREAGLLGNVPEYFAANRLAVITPADAHAIQALDDLAMPGVSIAIASEEVPAGNYARESLDKMSMDDAYPSDFATSVLSNVVTNETSVRGVAQKVALGEVDAGIVYETDAAADQYGDAVRMLEIPLQYNPAAQYPIAALSTTDQLEAAVAFIQFVQGDSGQAILREFGFVPPANITCPCHAGSPS